jgi:uncharacterized protein (TIGR02246 family)
VRIAIPIVLALMTAVGCHHGVRSHVAQSSESAADQRFVEELLAELSERWSRGDSAGIADLWVADGDVVTMAGGILRGKSSIRGFFAESIAAKPGSRFQTKLDAVRRLRSDIAIADGRWRLVSPDASAKRPEEGVYAMVLSRSGRSWRVVSLRMSVTSGGHTRGIGRAGEFPATE